MGVSVDNKPVAEMSALDLLEISRDPVKFQHLHDDLMALEAGRLELQAGQRDLERQRAELEVREAAAAALAAEAAAAKIKWIEKVVEWNCVCKELGEPTVPLP